MNTNEDTSDPDLARRLACYRRLAGTSAGDGGDFAMLADGLRADLRSRRMSLVEADTAIRAMVPRKVDYVWEVAAPVRERFAPRNWLRPFLWTARARGSAPLEN